MASQTTNPNPQTWDEIQASIADGGCPGCGGRPGKATEVDGVVHCQRCGGIFGYCYLGASYRLVREEWVDAEDLAEAGKRAIYFDLDCLGSRGIVRRHGWFDPVTRRITQTG